MITRISGILRRVGDDQLTLEIDAFEYQVLIPDFVRRQLQSRVGERISLHTVHYFDGNPAQGRVTPRLVGFLHETEREFFEMFCSVDGVGVRKALRAMVRPVQDVAVLIADQDAKGLAALPGIGPATAERIIAKLRRKMTRFALLVTAQSEGVSEAEHDIVRETYEVMRALGHSEADARSLIDATLATKKKFKDVDAMLQAIYEQQRG